MWIGHGDAKELRGTKGDGVVQQRMEMTQLTHQPDGKTNLDKCTENVEACQDGPRTMARPRERGNVEIVQ